MVAYSDHRKAAVHQYYAKPHNWYCVPGIVTQTTERRPSTSTTQNPIIGIVSPELLPGIVIIGIVSPELFPPELFRFRKGAQYLATCAFCIP